MDLLAGLDYYVVFGLHLAFLASGGYAFQHAIRQRSDAFTAVGKLTKNGWLGITGGATFVFIIITLTSTKPWDVSAMTPAPLGGFGTMLLIVGIVATMVYTVDVKPAVVGVQRGDQRW